MAVQTRASKKRAPDNKSTTAQISVDTNRASVPAKRKMAGNEGSFRRSKMPRGEGAPCCESPLILEDDQGICYNCRKGFQRGGRVNTQPARSLLGQCCNAPYPLQRGGTTICVTCGRHPISNDTSQLGLARPISVSYPMSVHVPGDYMLSEVNRGDHLASNNVGLQSAQAHGNTVALQAVQSHDNIVDQEPDQSLPKLCCASPDIVEDELGQSCANCGESYTGATVVGSFATGNFDSMQAPSSLRSTSQVKDYSESTTSTSKHTPNPVANCCNNPVPIAIDEGDGIHCFSCGTMLDPSILFAPMDDDQIAVAPTGTTEPDQEDSTKRLSAQEEKSFDRNEISIATHARSGSTSNENSGAVSEHTILPNTGNTKKPVKRGGSKKKRATSRKGARDFPKFLELPKEIRENIYGMVLQSDLPIRPHLCNTRMDMSGTRIQFHDDNRSGHDTVYASLAITRVSKQVRQESLPVFYGANTFDTVADTPTYFLRLQQLGRFEMIRKVDLGVQFWNSHNYSQKVLRMLLQNLAEQEAFEKTHESKQGLLDQLNRMGLDLLKSFEKQNHADEAKFKELPMPLGKLFMSLEDTDKKKARTLPLDLGDPTSSSSRFPDMAVDPLSHMEKSCSADLGSKAFKSALEDSCFGAKQPNEDAFNTTKSIFGPGPKTSGTKKIAAPQASTSQDDNLHDGSPTKAIPEALSHLAPIHPRPKPFITDDLVVLKSHPLHQMGGLEPNFLVLRMLSAAFQGGNYNRKLVLHVPVATLFDEYNGLVYFPSVCEGLGIRLQLVSGRKLETYGAGFKLSWNQKFQKKNFKETTTAKGGEQEHMILTKRVQKLYPNIEQVPRPNRRTYYRNTCKNGELEWFTIDTAGGGRL